MHDRKLVTFKEVYANYDAAESRQLAHLKRLNENIYSDPDFRAHLTENIKNPQVTADFYDIDVDMEACRSMYDATCIPLRYSDQASDWPLTQIWDEHIQRLLQTRDSLVGLSSTRGFDDKFDLWRRRQIARLNSELGPKAQGITHPLAAIELSKGCTVGCWFCGISADKFVGHWEFNEQTATEWRVILETLRDRFGVEAARNAFCYWGTDASDNPDYTKFLKIFEDVLEWLPQTTTAAPLRNVEFTRSVLRMMEENKYIVNRFSVLTLKMHRRIHREFSAEELFLVELIPQFKESLTMLANAGRAREKERLQTHNEVATDIVFVETPNDPEENESTIACVTGFLIRPIDRTIELVSPTKSTPETPDGYYIFGREKWTGPDDFPNAVDRLLSPVISLSPPKNAIASFRPDLSYIEMDDGFKLANRNSSARLRAQPWQTEVARMIASGDKTNSDLVKAAAELHGNPIETLAFLQQVRQGGFLRETVPYLDNSAM